MCERITRIMESLLSFAEECDTKERLEVLLAEKRSFTAYSGFEPSGRIHIAQGVTTVLDTNAIIQAGGKFIIYIADWVSQINGKMDGDLKKIQEAGEYFIEVFKAMGLDEKGVWSLSGLRSSSKRIPITGLVSWTSPHQLH